MLRTVSPFVFGLATFIPYAAAGFGFTSPNFAYVQLSSSQNIAWNGQSGDVELRMVSGPRKSYLESCGWKELGLNASIPRLKRSPGFVTYTV
jgi:hypothetical protein